jgi:sugar phosphate isomerase/epimerase
MNRRSFLARNASAAAAGLAAVGVPSAASGAPEKEPPSQPFLTPWSPPADRLRDLTPGKTPFRLASWSSKTTLDYPRDIGITEMVKRIRDSGYTSGCAHGGRLARSPWLDASESEIRELREALARYDVTFFDMHANANNIHPDPAERKKEIAWTIRQCEAAERVGCPVVTTHTGSCAPSAVSIHPDNWTVETWRLSVLIMKQILRDTAGMRVTLAIEPDNLANINNPRALRQLIEDVGDPRLAACFDPVNMIEPGNYYRTAELIEESFDLLGERIVVAHAKDSLILPDRMSIYITETAPGKGALDYGTFLLCLSRLSFPRTLIIEHIPDDDYPSAKKFIEETAARVGAAIYR